MTKIEEKEEELRQVEEDVIDIPPPEFAYADSAKQKLSI